MTNHDIIIRARDVADSIVRNGMSANINDWLVYGMALDYGKRNSTGGSNGYNRWIISNGLGGVPSTLRSYARIVASNWDDVEPFTRIGQPFHGVNDIKRLCSLSYKIKNNNPDNNTRQDDHPTFKGIDPDIAIKAMDDIALAVATMPRDTIHGAALLRAMDRLSTAVINSFKE